MNVYYRCTKAVTSAAEYLCWCELLPQKDDVKGWEKAPKSKNNLRSDSDPDLSAIDTNQTKITAFRRYVDQVPMTQSISTLATMRNGMP